MEFTVREAEDRDALAVAGLRWDFRAEDDGEAPAVTREEFEAVYIEFFRKGRPEASRTHIVAAVSRQIVGHIVVQAVDMVPRPCKVVDQWGYVTDNYVRPIYRSRGIGRALLEEAIRWSVARDLELLLVWPTSGRWRTTAEPASQVRLRSSSCGCVTSTIRRGRPEGDESFARRARPN